MEYSMMRYLSSLISSRFYIMNTHARAFFFEQLDYTPILSSTNCLLCLRTTR